MYIFFIYLFLLLVFFRKSKLMLKELADFNWRWRLYLFQGKFLLLICFINSIYMDVIEKGHLIILNRMTRHAMYSICILEQLGIVGNLSTFFRYTAYVPWAIWQANLVFMNLHEAGETIFFQWNRMLQLYTLQ